MIFGETPVEDAEGAVLAHSIRMAGASFKKGRVLSAADLGALRDAGVESVVVARLEPGDIPEDEAATRIARASAGERLAATAAFAGRVNLIAEARGIVVVDPRTDALNRADEAVTIATLPAWELVQPKQIVATVKIIPFAVPGAALNRCESIARESAPLVRVAPLRRKTAGLIQTTLPGAKARALDKTRGVLTSRLEALGSRLKQELRCGHTVAALKAGIEDTAASGCDLILIAGASAIADRRDVIPAALGEAGGETDHFGMPVDPGNLLMLGRLGSAAVVGLPGCARSPKFNGVDWVLQRLCADLPLTSQDIMAMGIGGLLKEMPGRPRPRADTGETVEAPRAPNIAAIILAAGQSRRMGRRNNRLAPVDGKPMVRWVAEAAIASGCGAVLAVLGHETEQVRQALDGLPVAFVENPDYAQGISTSVRRGVAALPDDADGAAICLGDMPRITAAQIGRLIAAYNPVEGRALCVPTWQGKRGNPVLIGRRFFPEVHELSGDVGARPLLSQYPELICEVEMGDDAVLIDVDTPQALNAING